MCLLIVKPAGYSFNREWSQDFFDHNSDGCGYAYAENGKLYVGKIIPKSGDEAYEFLKPLHDKKAVIHWRMKTKGLISLENVHPYQVLRKDQDGKDLWYSTTVSCKSIPQIPK